MSRTIQTAWRIHALLCASLVIITGFLDGRWHMEGWGVAFTILQVVFSLIYVFLVVRAASKRKDGKIITLHMGYSLVKLVALIGGLALYVMLVAGDNSTQEILGLIVGVYIILSVSEVVLFGAQNHANMG